MDWFRLAVEQWAVVPFGIAVKCGMWSVACETWPVQCGVQCGMELMGQTHMPIP